MTSNGYWQIGLYLLVLVALVKPLGWYMARVYEGKPIALDRIGGPIERVVYRAGRNSERREENCQKYGITGVRLKFLGVGVVYVFQRV